MKKIFGILQHILKEKELIHILLDAFEAKDIAEGNIIIQSQLLNGKLKDTILQRVEQIEDYTIGFSEDQIELKVKVKYGLWLVSILYTVGIVDFVCNTNLHKIDLKYTEKMIDMVGIGGKLVPKIGRMVKKISNKNYIQFVKLPTGIIITRDRIIGDMDYIDVIKDMLRKQESLNEIYQQLEIDNIEIKNDEMVFHLVLY